MNISYTTDSATGKTAEITASVEAQSIQSHLVIACTPEIAIVAGGGIGVTKRIAFVPAWDSSREIRRWTKQLGPSTEWITEVTDAVKALTKKRFTIVKVFGGGRVRTARVSTAERTVMYVHN